MFASEKMFPTVHIFLKYSQEIENLQINVSYFYQIRLLSEVHDRFSHFLYLLFISVIVAATITEWNYLRPIWLNSLFRKL